MRSPRKPRGSVSDQMRNPPISETAAQRRVEAPLTLRVQGMTCAGCVETITENVDKIAAINDVRVDLEAGRVEAWPSAGSDEQLARNELIARLAELGYSVTDDDEVDRRGLRLLMTAAGAALVLAAAGFYVLSRVQDAYLAGGFVADPQQFFSTLGAGPFALAFLFGLLVGFSPLTLAAAPAVMGYAARTGRQDRRRPIALAIAFTAGMVSIDLVVGGLFAAVGTQAIAFFSSRLAIWYALMTAVLVVLGVILFGGWRPRVPWRQRRPDRVGTVGGAYLAGIPFGLLACPGCTPLLLPVALGAVATGSPLAGAALMGAFAVGRGIPLVAAGASTGALVAARSVQRHLPLMERTVATLLLLGAIFFAAQFVLTVGTRGLG